MVTGTEPKKSWQSKTNWTALAIAVAGFFPQVASWIAENPEAYGGIVASIFSLLRLITKDKVTIV